MKDLCATRAFVNWKPENHEMLIMKIKGGEIRAKIKIVSKYHVLLYVYLCVWEMLERFT